MTTIVAVEKDSQVAIAADSMSSAGSLRSAYQASPPKIHRAGSSLIGCAGFTVYRNLLDHYISSKKTPELRDERAIFEYLLKFWRDLHKRYHMIDDKHDSDDPAPFADLGAAFIIANRYGIFVAKEILDVSRFDKFCAIGSGADHAEGALQILYDQKGSAKEIAEKAVDAALVFDAASGGPVNVFELKRQPARARSKSTKKTKRKTTSK